jgi:hypothetical protein
VVSLHPSCTSRAHARECLAPSHRVRQQVPQADCSIGPLFKCLIENQQRLSIEDFSVSQTTLEDVFLFFARQQTEEAVASK